MNVTTDKDSNNQNTNTEIANEISVATFWDSPEAKCWFGNGLNDKSVEEVIVKRIKQFREAYITANGWKQIISNNDQKDQCTHNDIYNLRSKAMYLAIALQLALEQMPTHTWGWCCDEAVRRVQQFRELLGENDEKDVGVKYGGTIQRWFRIWKRNSECFLNPYFVRHGKQDLPQLLQNYPTLKKNLIKTMEDNLEHLSGEFVFSYLMDTALPLVLNERRQELNNYDFSLIQLLNENGLTKLLLSTVYRWMGQLGFLYSERRKCYYVDNHEHPENKKYRRTFLKRYFEYELRAHRWIQIPKMEAIAMVERGQICNGQGYKYIVNELTMVEFHVDDSIIFQDRMEQTTKFGGNLSVRKPVDKKPLFIIGQDKCIFKQYIFTKKGWYNSEGAMQLIPKDDGIGLMISAFVSHEFGYGFELSDGDLQKVNDYRRGKRYSDEAAAVIKKGNAIKKSYLLTFYK